MSDTSPHWYDDDAGPIVRLFAVTAGRARSTTESFDLMATVHVASSAPYDPSLSPEQQLIMRICRRYPQTITDVASESNLPLGVVRVLLGDLLNSGHVQITPPAPHRIPDSNILKEVIDGLRAL
ncbi:DUF742 domain-containing protein [Phytoactinopolyspora mesophila]|uniref:DUF742 domain-containing protein n=1 Tax=Phytoactinopolyspora mesophila TaxID=2650750 RepID=A0A7K3M2K7_9ACTN|nr:DUF742 domain-containing protein [Phytoactinopolyspora mesophila]NDL57524.1 DUF742 domain-containing protein [Phytoactinopolyspora mesophila]